MAGYSFRLCIAGNQVTKASIFTCSLLGMLFASTCLALAAGPLPNVVLIYADDLGYGDVGAYGSVAIPTPHIDRLAASGLRFLDGHAASATCTPSRYSLLTGEYAWRQKGTGILPGDASLIIKPGRMTLASLFQKAGYRTGAVGKWHLGLGREKINWNRKIEPGPNEIGFDESFIMAATADRVPCVYLQNGNVVGLDPADPIEVNYKEPFPGEPTGRDNPELLKMKFSHGHDMSIVNGISRIGHMKGGKAALWKDEDMADRFTTAAVNFIEKQSDKPFFLYFALHDPHVPRVPHPRFVGKTQLGPRGDAIVQADWCVGEVVSALERRGLMKNTLVIFSSDNGPVIDDGYEDEAVARLGSHKPSGPFRGGKYSKFEAGTRVPFIVSWPGQIKPGTSPALLCQIDLLASFASLTHQPLQTDEGVDSFNVLDALLGKTEQGRESLIEQGVGGLAIRSGQWKFIPASNGPERLKNTNVETGNASGPQLYSLKDDPGETTNLAQSNPRIVEELRTRLNQIREAGRSRPE